MRKQSALYLVVLLGRVDLGAAWRREEKSAVPLSRAPGREAGRLPWGDQLSRLRGDSDDTGRSE